MRDLLIAAPACKRVDFAEEKHLQMDHGCLLNGRPPFSGGALPGSLGQRFQGLVPDKNKLIALSTI